MIRFLCFFILISSSVMNLRAQESPVLKLSLQEILDLSDKQSHTLKKGNYNIERVENELAASRLQWAPGAFSFCFGRLFRECDIDKS